MVVTQPANGAGEVAHEFDACLGETSSQSDVFDAVGRPAVDALLGGVCVGVLCYGAGAGKQHTFMGTRENPGLARRIGRTLFADLRPTGDARGSPQLQHDVRVRYYLLRDGFATIDLLQQPGAGTPGDYGLRKSRSRGVHVGGLVELLICDAEKLDEALSVGEEHRRSRDEPGYHAVLEIELSRPSGMA